MSLPNGYTMKTGAIRAYFDAIQNAEAPARFSQKFLAGLGFSSSNDRLLIGILKDLGFLNADGAPTNRYFRFLDKANSERVLAEGIREAFSDLFEVNRKAYELGNVEVYNKLRTLYRGEKKDTVIKLIAKTFTALSEYANFDGLEVAKTDDAVATEPKTSISSDRKREERDKDPGELKQSSKIDVNALQYHLNIVLPDTRDQAVYDAIFKSMRDHLG